VVTRDRKPSPRFLVLIAATMLGLSFAPLFLTPVHGFTPVATSIGTTDMLANHSSFIITGSVISVGDVVAVVAGVISTNVSTYTVTGVGSPSVTGGFTQQLITSSYCQEPGLCGGGAIREPFSEQLFTGVATSAGAISITMNLSHQAPQAGGQAFDLQFVGATPANAGGGACPAVVSTSCPSPMTTPFSFPFSSGQALEIVGAATRGTAVGSATTGWTFSGSGATNFGGAFSTTASSVSSPTNFAALNFNGGSGLNSGYALIGAIFAPSSVTVSTTINTMCTGACSGGNNGTGNYLVRNQLYVYSSQNVAATGTIDNITLKFGAIHMNVTQGTLYVSIYTATGPPTGGNPYTQVVGPTGSFAVPIFNASSANTFIHLNPQTQICGSCYYAVGVMASPEGHSRGSGAANSGVQVLETSQAGLTEYVYAPAGPSGTAQHPPNQFFSTTTFTPHHFIFIHEIFPVAIATTTVTDTTAINGTATATVTFTATTLDLALATTSMTTDVILLLVILAPAVLLLTVTAALTRSAPASLLMFVVGLMVGSGLGVYANLVPPVFMALSVIIGVLLIFGISRMNGGISSGGAGGGV
jgi:hypothetical protein